MANEITGHRYRGSLRGSTSEFKGVSFRPGTGKWQATIRNRYLGVFDTEEGAARAYDTAALEMFGVDTFLNFPGGAPRPTEETHNRCNTCDKVKPLAGFSPAKGMRLGVRNICKLCASEKAIRRNHANTDRVLDGHFRRRFGITLNQYVALVAEQGGMCAICKEPPRVEMGIRSTSPGRRVEPRLAVDHDHETGRVRGLLCQTCNAGIGMLRDDPDLLRSALKYLEERT